MQNVFASSISRFVRCGPNYSFFFDLIAKESEPTNKPLHRFCSLMRKMGVTGYFREVLEQNAEIKAEIVDARYRTRKDVSGDAIRFTFFRNGVVSNDPQAHPKNSILGYLVLLKFRMREKLLSVFVLESVVREPSVWLKNGDNEKCVPLTNYYVHCRATFSTRVGVRGAHAEFTLVGAFFCEQSGFTHVCAHAALRAAWNSTPGLLAKGKLTNRAINQVLGIDHRRDTVGRLGPAEKIPPTARPRGLKRDEIEAVIRKYGGYYMSATFVDESGLDYERYVYPLLETGWPVILGIYGPGVAHVVTLLGHTLNSDRWMPEARRGYGDFTMDEKYLSAVEWTDHFIAHDDNYGMYVTLPTEALKSVVLHRFNPHLHTGLAIALAPSGVKLSGMFAESYAIAGMQRLLDEVYRRVRNRWVGKLRDSYVCRTLLQTKNTYLQHFEETESLADTYRDFLNQVLPNRFWVTEFTVPHLYSANKHKLADILVRCDNCPESERVIFAWLPGHAYWGDTSFEWPIRNHIPLLRDGGSSPLEW